MSRTNAARGSTDDLIAEGFAKQRAHRREFEAIAPEERRRWAERAVRTLARRLREENPGYARLYETASDSLQLPVLEKSRLGASFDEFATGTGATRASMAAFAAKPFSLGSRLDTKHLAFSSSGSSGEPLPVLHHVRDFGRSLEAFVARGVRGARPGAERLLYIGLLDRHNGGNAWMYYLGGHLDVVLADVFAEPGSLLDVVGEHRPDVVLTRPHLLRALAAAAAERGVALPQAHLLSVGEGLQPEQRREITAGWGSPPHNSYSTVETGPLGYQEDPALDELTVYDDLHLVELLDAGGVPVTEPGVPGRLVVSTLYRDVLPLIRYRVGDVASWRNAELTRLSFPHGRDTTVVRLSCSGGVMEMPELPLWSIVVPGVRQYQVVQTGPDSLLVRYEPSGTSSSTTGAALRDAVFAKLAGQSCDNGVRVTTELVPALLPDRVSGKIKRVIPWLPQR
jgi:phenylacetate-CoA ligase